MTVCVTICNRFSWAVAERAHLWMTENRWSGLWDWKQTVQVCTLSLSTTNVDFNTPPLTWFAPLMQDSWGKSRKDPQNSNKFSVPTQSWFWKTSVCFLCHHRASLGSKSYRQLWVSQFTKCRVAFALALHLALALLCNIRSSWEVPKLVHHSLVSLSMHIRLDVHDQRWQLSDSVLLFSRDHVGSLCVYRGCSPLTRSIIGFTTVIL